MNGLERKCLLKPISWPQTQLFTLLRIEIRGSKVLKTKKSSCDTLSTPSSLECHVLFEWLQRTKQGNQIWIQVSLVLCASYVTVNYNGFP